MAPPGFDARETVTQGNDKTIGFRVPIRAESRGQYIVRARFTLKEERFLGLSDSFATMQKTITDIDVPGVGVISDTGLTTPYKALGDFTLTSAETRALTPGVEYLFDIVVTSNLNHLFTPRRGVLVVTAAVTQS